MTRLNVNLIYIYGNEYKEPKKHDRYFCMGCKLRNIVDY